MRSLIFILILTLSLGAKAQTAKIEIPETYELSNIILALTDYGIEDKWEVQKNTDYYKQIISYFKPVSNHPLLDSVNYSREKWESYLSFRTDAVAFSFDENGNLKRDFKFYTNPGHNPFEENLALINDFVEKSNFRKFYADNEPFYNKLISRYEDYNFVKETVEFLDLRVGRSKQATNADIYKIILSPLVYRMNCHRQLQKNIEADFPSATEDFINGVSDDSDIKDRLNSNHLIFTEKDHEYVNPISDRYAELIKLNFDNKYWDIKSGYSGINSFNEYMTWAVYDLFLDEKFPTYAKEFSTYWQYQNASRGFFAQNLFSNKVRELYHASKDKKLEAIYEPLLKWAKKNEQQITCPTLVNIDNNTALIVDPKNIELNFSESMNTKQSFGIEIREMKNGKQTNEKVYTDIKNCKWSNKGKTLHFDLETDYDDFVILFNWWGIEKPLVSKNGIFLKVGSAVSMKKKE